MAVYSNYGAEKLAEIKKSVDALALKIAAPEHLLPTYGYSKDFAYPHLETDALGQLHFVVVERGEELQRRTTKNLDELLFWIFERVTFSLASNFELTNRIAEQDSRRILFARQEELLASLNLDWGKLCENSHREVLEKYPYDDLAGLRATYCHQLRNQGYTETEIGRMAQQKYPDS